MPIKKRIPPPMPCTLNRANRQAQQIAKSRLTTQAISITCTAAAESRAIPRTPQA